MVRGLACVTAAVIYLAASRAEAYHCDCGQPPVPNGASLRSERVAADGVLTFGVYSSFFRDVRFALPYFEVQVVDATGDAIAGALEVHEEFGLAAWRPDAGWPETPEVHVRWQIDLEALAHSEYDRTIHCPPLEGEGVVEIVPVPLVADPVPIVEERFELVPSESLGDLVCCDGSYPYEYGGGPGPGSCPNASPPRVDLGPGICGSTTGSGRLELTASLEPADLDELELQNFRVRLVEAVGVPPAPASRTITVQAPTCLRVEMLDLARSTVHGFDSCHGHDIESQLGSRELDPAAELADCEGRSYVCTVELGAWDPEQCEPWPTPEVTSRGCGCTTPRQAPLACTAMLLTLMTRRRAHTPLFPGRRMR
jgi:hypothetical protein